MSKLDRYREEKAKLEATSDARRRITLLFDEGSFTELDQFVASAAQKSGVITGYGTIEGAVAYAFSQDVQQQSGAMCRSQITKLEKVYELALKTGCPVIGIYDSLGAKLDEAGEAMLGYSKLMRLANNLSGVVPQISVVAGVCAGAAAIAATAADVVIVSKKAQLFLTAPSIAKAQGQGVEGAGTAENAAKAGVAHMLEADDTAAILAAKKLVGMLPPNNLSVAPIFEFTENDGAPLNAMAENGAEADASAILTAIADAGSILELQAQYGAGVTNVLATIGGCVCGFTATKGGALTPEDSAKIARFVSVCDSFQIPLISLVNTVGFAASSQSELAGAIQQAAKLTYVYAEATTAKIALITGQAYGAAYIALAGRGAGADLVYAWPGAVISALDPAAAVTMLSPDKITATTTRQQVVEEYKNNEASPFVAAQQGFIDTIIEPAATRSALIAALDLLASKREHRLPKKHGNIPM